VAAESAYNQMDLFNLSTIFAPTVLRPAKPDFTNAAKAFNEVRLCQLVMKHLLDVPPSKRVVGLTTLREYQPGREPEPPVQVQEPIKTTEESSKNLLVDAIASALTTSSLEASLGGKMKNRVTSFARTPKNSTGEGRTSLFSALSSTPSEDDTNFSRQLPVVTAPPKRRLSEPDFRRESRQSFGNSLTARPSILEVNSSNSP